MASTIYYDKNDIAIKFNPQSKIYPYVRIDCPCGDIEFETVEDLDEFISALKQARNDFKKLR